MNNFAFIGGAIKYSKNITYMRHLVLFDQLLCVASRFSKNYLLIHVLLNATFHR